MKTEDKGKCLRHGRFMCCKCRDGEPLIRKEHLDIWEKDCADFINEQRYIEQETHKIIFGK